MGSPGFLPASLLASLDEGGRPRKGFAEISIQTPSWPQASGDSTVLRTGFQALPHHTGIAAAFPERALLPVFLQPEAALPRRDSSFALGAAKRHPRDRAQHHGATGRHRTSTAARLR